MKTTEQLEDELARANERLTGLDRMLCESRETEQALRKSEERYRNLVENTSDWIWETDKNFRCTYTNSRIRDVLGFEPEEILGKAPTEFMLTEDADLAGPFLDKLLLKPRAFFGLESRQLNKDGSTRCLEVSIVPVFNEDQSLAGFRGVTRDITIRKKMEEDLQTAEERFRLVSQAANDAIYDWNIVSGTLWLSESYHLILDFQENMNHFKWWKTRLHPADRKRIMTRLRSIQKSLSDVWMEEYRFRRADGRYIYIIDRGQIIRNEKGRPVRIVGSLRDVTSRKLAEEALASSEENYRRLIEDSPIGIIVYSPHGTIIMGNRRAQLLLETSEADMLGKSPHQPAWKLVRTDGRPMSPDEHPVSLAIARNAPVNDILIAVIRPVSETTGWFLVNAQPQWDQEGNLLRVIESFIDITMRINTLEALSKSEAKYRFLTERTSDIVWTLDNNLFFTYISPSVKRALDYSQAELLGHNVSEFMPPETFDRVKEILNEEIIPGQQSPVDPNRNITIDTVLLHKNGSVVWFENIVGFIRDKEDNVTGIYGVSRNVNEYKLAQEEKEKLISELKQALAEVKTLSGLLPICSSCKKIRDDRGYWNQLEGYITDHSEALFSHSLCPDCAEKLYEDIDLFKIKNRQKI